MPTIDDIASELQFQHRKRRFAMKVQQKIDRALESYVRRFYTNWRPDLPEEERKKENAKALALIKAATAKLKDVPSCDKCDQVLPVVTDDDEILELVQAAEISRRPWDQKRKKCEAIMRELAEQLPVYPWVEAIPGAAALGLATIVAEAGPLHKYATPAKLWKRFGFAPFEGLAGSTWKREKWRPRKLTPEEWVANPFSGERYALMIMIAESLFRAQWIGKDKDPDGKGKPKGPYGEAYAKRRARTAETHPDWSDGHAKADALRVMMKKFLLDLWNEWDRITTADHTVGDTHVQSVGHGAGRAVRDSQITIARPDSPIADQNECDTHDDPVGDAAGHSHTDPQLVGARRSSKKSKSADQPQDDIHRTIVGRGAVQSSVGSQVAHDRPTASKKSTDQKLSDNQKAAVGRGAARHSKREDQTRVARRANKFAKVKTKNQNRSRGSLA